ncbi:TetR/AcrR family transcriptional regulator [Nocardioides ginsengisoli]|uniref:TetR/AcrR family transcriptional regulator n=1 Tax=Nocardioides ginsengisoli TaxID=363868 RepID=A0ABW3VXT0_9ACTN
MSADTRRTKERSALGREAILAAATELAASGAAITFRGLGSALGADPTAIYRRFRDKDELMAALLDGLIAASLDGVDRDAPWRDQLRSGAVSTIDIFAAHPQVGAEATAISTGGPGELAVIDWILSQLDRAGLDRQQVVRCYAAYSSYVLAAAATMSQQQLKENEGVPPSSWVGDLRAVDPTRHPALSSVLPELLVLTPREVFLEGIDVLLDSFEAIVDHDARA